MPSTFSDLKIELIATGEQSGTWGNTTNTNLGTALEEAIVGRAAANFTIDADLTLTLTDTNATQVARNFILNVTSGVSLTATRNLIVPTIDKPYIVENNTTGGQSIVVKTSAGSGVTVPNGKTMMVYANSTNVVPAFTNLPADIAITGSLSVSGTSSSSGDIKLYEDADNGTNYVSIKAPTAIGSNATVTIPATDNVTLGYLNIPQSGSAKTTSYILATTDVGRTIEVGTGGSITIPDSTFSAGDALLVFNNTTGSITITCSITTAYIAGTDADKATMSLSTRGIASILFVSGTTCVVSGNVS